MAELLGQQLGNYRLVSLISQGNFGDVYLGEHIHLSTQAAIKVLRTHLASDEVEQYRFEARSIAHLVHPHIIRVFDFGVENRIPFLVMDYAPHGTLRQRHPKGIPLALATVVNYVKQIADALQYAHDAKLIHRDVKPENMLIGRRYEILLSDFGIAVLNQSSRYQRVQDMAGTIGYMAPEQIQGRPHPASDQYALGIVVYEWLSGDRPFHGTFTEIAAQHTTAPPRPLHEKVPGILPEIEQVVTRALAKDPQQRFPSVKEFALALEQVTPPLIFVAIPPPPPPPPLQPEYTQVKLEGSASPVPEKPVKRGVSRRVVIASLAVAVMAGLGIAVIEGRAGNTAPSSTPGSASLPLTYSGHTDGVYAVVWSPDGKRIASGSWDKTVQVWGAMDGAQVYTYRGHTDEVWATKWSPDGRYIASGSWDKTVQVWEAANGNQVYSYLGHTDRVYAITWSPDSKRIASGSGREGSPQDYTVQLWDALDGNHVYVYRGHSDAIRTVAWSPDGGRIASGGDDSTVQIWDAVNGSGVLTYSKHTNAVRIAIWSPDGKQIASGSEDETVQVWDALGGGMKYTYRRHSGAVWALAWSPDGKRIASGGEDSTVQVWNAADGSYIFTYSGHSDAIRSVAWSPDGKLIASASADKTVQIWQAPH